MASEDSLPKPRILIVDDNVDQLRMLEAALHERYEILTASDGLDAYALACHAKPAAIILDIAMPIVDGWTMLRKLRSNHATQRIPVVVFTALEIDQIQREAKLLDVAVMVRKPASGKELDVVLRRVIKT